MRAHRAAAGHKSIVREARHSISGEVRQLAEVAAFSVVCLAALLTSDAARSQTRGEAAGEVPLGTFNIRNPHNGFSVVEPPAGMPEAKSEANDDGSNRWFFEGWQKSAPADTAEKLYGEAMAALEGGRVDQAQPLFERLIAEAPRSVQATEARQHLGRIYSTTTGSTTPTAYPVPAPAHAPTGAGATAAAVEAGSTWTNAETRAALAVDRPLSRSALLQARVSADIDGRFLSAAGDRVFFSAGSASLGTRAQSVIQAQARFLTQNPWLSAAVEGHADDGALPDEETVELSERRAAVVRDRLIAEGVASDRLTAYGRGREERVSDCPDAACLAQNRRTITILLQSRIKDGGRGSGSAEILQSPAFQ
ncbi:OmpA family protein [Hyphomicrobium sp.]|uniref:OmpA family protein n=1 Tax=Hyphomicrobium sp. TaxID=82 RepID=UPI003F71C0D5